MIDNQLLTKVCANDEMFRQQIISKVLENASIFAKKLNESARKSNWSACYYQMLDFYHAITPYGKMSFLKDFQKTIDTISHTDDVHIKRGVCLKFLTKLNAQMKAASATTLRKQSKNVL